MQVIPNLVIEEVKIPEETKQHEDKDEKVNNNLEASEETLDIGEEND